MPLIHERTAEPSKRRGRSWALGCLGVQVIIVLVLWGYIYWANHLPPEPAPLHGKLPSPNGYDAVVAAVYRVYGTPGSSTINDPVVASPGELRESVQALQPALNQLRAALRLPFVNPPIDSKTNYLAPFPAYRKTARALAAEVRVARRSGQHARAVSSGLDALELGVKVQRGGTYIHCRLSRAVCAIPMRQMEASIAHLTGAEARQLGRRLDRILLVRTPLIEIVRTDAHLDQVRLLREARRPPRFTPSDDEAGEDLGERGRRILTHYFYPKGKAYASLCNFYQRLEQEAAKPRWQRQPVLFPTDPYLAPWEVDSIHYLNGETHELNDSRLQILRLELALREFQASEDRLPAKLEDLAPRFVPSIQPDPFTGKPLLYRPTGSKYRLYSVGPDGVDNGGTSQQPGKQEGDVAAGGLLPAPVER